jgi:ubiquinone/menaquinone biosynthesis C-methylase UbiE
VYDLVVEPMQAGVRRVAVEFVPPDPAWQVLDVGCGTGTGMVPYVEAGCTVVGVDVSPSMLERARARLGDRVELYHTDGESLPFEAGRFDLVTTSMVLHEVPADRRTGFVDQMARVAGAGGRLQIVDFGFGSLRPKGWALRAVSELVEQLSGHYSQYRSFKAAGGVPEVVDTAGHRLEREKIVAGGNIGIFVVAPLP